MCVGGGGGGGNPNPQPKVYEDHSNAGIQAERDAADASIAQWKKDRLKPGYKQQSGGGASGLDYDKRSGKGIWADDYKGKQSDRY